MDPKILADTSVLIGLQRNEKPIVANFQKHLKLIFISRITTCEFIYGSRDKKEKQTNKEFLEQLAILEVSEEISRCAYQLLDKYSLKFNIGIADAFIAAAAIIHDCSLWTLNGRHFRCVTELSIVKL